MNKLSCLLCFGLLSVPFSCQIKQKDTRSKVSVGPLVWDIAPDQKFIERKGADSYIAYLVDGHKDTFTVEYGSPGIIASLYVPGVAVFNLSHRESVIRQAGRVPTPDEVVFSDYPKEDYDLRIFEKNFWLYDTINGIVTKIVQSKRIGDGLTGIYSPKLKDGMSFSMYCKNLDSAADQRALAMFRTIRYNQDIAR